MIRDTKLIALAERYGIQLAYEDATGRTQHASPEAVEAIVDARRSAISTKPAIVVWDGGDPPGGDIELEDGSEWRRDGALPHGYHTLHDGSLIIAAPKTAHPIDGKRWGLFVPLHSVGERPNVRDLVAWSRLGGDFVATLPLLAPHGGERSPYSPSTRLRWNEAIGDLRAVANEIDLYLDFPLGVHPEGEDVRNFADCFAKGVATGAPPDPFFTEGQNWGFPPPDPDGIRANRFEYFRAALRHHVEHAAILRIDHMMSLHRLYWIPDGADAKDGAYVRYPHEELYAILTLESRRARCAIVGEDLGTVPQEVRDAMERHGLRRMFVVQHDANERGIGTPQRESLACLNTHDMPPFAAFWRDAPPEIREALARQFGEGDILESLLRHIAASPAELVLVNPEDLWGETEPQNVPGVPERSWTHRFRLTLDEARRNPRVQRLLRAVQGARLATK